ncbi:MAG: RNA polymerase sigma factor, partial [Nocardiopsaceae bacterium]|nr:RNA polymerase sigma factor [Nocardiopsaceae bacterium]
YTVTAGDKLTAPDLSDEAIRLTRWLGRLLPDDAEVTGLLALMLLTDARRRARTTGQGEIVLLADQDRSLWDADKIAEGVALISGVLPRGEVGPYQLQAAIAAVHDEAESMAVTDWPQILVLYDLLVKVAPNPVTALNRAVAVAEVLGPAAGLEELAALETDSRIAGGHLLIAARAHMLEQSGETAAAAECYREAAKRATSRPVRANLAQQAARLSG